MVHLSIDNTFDQQFAMMETVISGLVDEFPKVLRQRKMILTLFLCIAGFLLGLPQCTRVSTPLETNRIVTVITVDICFLFGFVIVPFYQNRIVKVISVPDICLFGFNCVLTSEVIS